MTKDETRYLLEIVKRIFQVLGAYMARTNAPRDPQIIGNMRAIRRMLETLEKKLDQT